MNEVHIAELDTPAVLVDRAKLEANIQDMAEMAKSNGVALRPHAKAHKTVEIAQLQLEHGAVGLTVSKISEGDALRPSLVRDILVAYPIVGSKAVDLRDLSALLHRASTVVDSEDGVRALSECFAAVGAELDVLLKVDVGLNRCGVEPCSEKAFALVDLVCELPGLTFAGILTHAGQVYGVSSPEDVTRIGREEGQVMVDFARELAARGTPAEAVSVGSTPTVRHSAQIDGVTEIRPGNYVFYDAMQIGLGSAELAQCSLSVLATVVSRPAPQRAILDSGSKTLALDKGAHGTEIVKGFGIICDPLDTAQPMPELTLARLSEEHGVVTSGEEIRLKVGQKVRIVPNHACTVVNLADMLHVTEGEKVVDEWQVAARGRAT